MELVNILYNGTGIESQAYSTTDERLITNSFLNVVFGNPNDYIESFIYDDAGQLLESDYLLERYSPNSAGAGNLNQYSSVTLDPKADLNEKGYTRGSLNIQYNFLRTLFNSSYTTNYWIKEISATRTELKLTSQVISDSSIKAGFDDYQAYAQSKNYYSDFYLNFGNNELIIAINVAYTEDENGSYILIKLYEPLPLEYDVKSTLWIVDKVAESVSYNVDVQVEAEPIINENALRGPNFKISINDKVGQTTPYYNYQNLFASSVSSSFQQLMSYFDDKAITINVDYTNFSNFVHFSSAAERLNNFVYKLRLIESYNAQIAAQKSLSGGGVVASGSINQLTQSIQNITEKFDNYEYYLYYSSESFAWPKSNSTKPYALYSVTSSQALNWLGSETTVPTATTASVLYSASLYDVTNKDLLTNTIPQYLQDDINNQPYVTFLNMIGQHFDNIWVYYKDVTNRYNNTNNPETGISIDMVADALRGLGISLYTNTSLSNDLYYSLFGIQANGSLLPPTGSEVITNVVTSSIATIAPNQLEKEVYKRIYHNLPYLLKTKGTHRGVKALLACYGVPEEILQINEFGGVNRYEEIGIYEINNHKVDIVTSSLEISSSLLDPYTTIQYHTTDNRMDVPIVEVGFSPANTINQEISSSLGYFNIDQYIGAPDNQYSSSYKDLDTLKNTYFAAYDKRHSINEYIRLIKFYNNSLFKMIKDFVPARADLSTGIIVKPHILERNKYARHEPTVTTSSHESNIDMISISATDAPELKYTTDYIETIQSVSGSVAINHTDNYEKYTGEFGGTIINPHTSYFSQSEQSYQPGSTIAPIMIPLTATYQNISASVKSTRFFDLDYSSNQSVPVNLGLITQSINQGPISQEDPYAPYAQLQDYNYSVRRSVIPRYSGSYLSGKFYNTHSIGDVSYGDEPVINRYSNKLGLFTQLATGSVLPGKVNVSLAYLVDVEGGLLELNQQNKSWQDVQNIFKAGNTLTIKQFDNKKYSNQKSTDGIKSIYNSGYSYVPLFYYGINDKTASFEIVESNQSGSFLATTIGGYLGTGSASPYTNTYHWTSASVDDPSVFGDFCVTDVFNSSEVVYDPDLVYSGTFTPASNSFAYFSPKKTDFYGFSINNLVIDSQYQVNIGDQGFQALNYYIQVSSSFGELQTTITPVYNVIREQMSSTFNAFIQPVQLSSGSRVYFSLYRIPQASLTDINGYIETINTGSIFQSTKSGGYPYALSPFISSSVSTQICLNTQLATFYNNIFLPQGFGSNPSSSLYPKYGDVNDIFTMVAGDVLQIQYNNVYYISEIINVDTTSGSLCINLNSPLPSSLINASGSFTDFLILKKKKDEQSAYLSFNKAPGATSYGFIIPENINPTVLENINTIQSAVQSQLLSNQVNTTG